MNRDELIEAALQCGVWIPMDQGKEREQTIDRLQCLVGRAIAVEREECAVICDDLSGSDYLPNQCAEAIRTRGEK